MSSAKNIISPVNFSNIKLKDLKISTITLSCFTSIQSLNLSYISQCIPILPLELLISTDNKKQIGPNNFDYISMNFNGKKEGLATLKKKNKSSNKESSYASLNKHSNFGKNAIDYLVTYNHTNINLKPFCNGTINCVGAPSFESALYVIIDFIEKLKKMENQPYTLTSKSISKEGYTYINLAIRFDMINYNINPTIPLHLKNLIKTIEQFKKNNSDCYFDINYNNLIDSAFNITWLNPNDDLNLSKKDYCNIVLYWKSNSSIKYKKMSYEKIPNRLCKFNKKRKPTKVIIRPNGESGFIFSGNDIDNEMPRVFQFLISILQEYYKSNNNKTDDTLLKEPNIEKIIGTPIVFTNKS